MFTYFILLDNLLLLFGHRRQRLAVDLHRAVRSLVDHEIERAVRRILLRIVVAEMRAAAFLALQGRERDGFGNREQIVQIERGVPAGIVFAIAADAHFAGALFQLRDPFQRALQLILAADDAHQILHQVLQIVLHLIRAFPLPLEGLERLAAPLHPPARWSMLPGSVIFRELRRKLARALAEDHQIGQRIAAQPIRAMQSRAAFSGGEQAVHVRHLRIGIHANAAHHIVRRRARSPSGPW